VSQSASLRFGTAEGQGVTEPWFIRVISVLWNRLFVVFVVMRAIAGKKPVTHIRPEHRIH
jgi:hypothetical protein